jgi:hypothetical protein
MAEPLFAEIMDGARELQAMEDPFRRAQRRLQHGPGNESSDALG